MGTDQQYKTASAAELTGRKPRVGYYTVHLDDELAEKVEQIRQERAKARRDGTEEDAPSDEELAAAEDALREVTRTIRFESIGRTAYDDMVSEHPPTEEQRAEMEEAGAVVEWNPDTFPPALVHASMVEPDLTDKQFAEIWDVWSNADLSQMFALAMRLNTTRRLVAMGNG